MGKTNNYAPVPSLLSSHSKILLAECMVTQGQALFPSPSNYKVTLRDDCVLHSGKSAELRANFWVIPLKGRSVAPSSISALQTM